MANDAENAPGSERAPGKYWVKVSTRTFEDDKIKLIESLPSGDTLLVIWLKLLIQAGKCNAGGLVYIAPHLPANEEALHVLLGRPKRYVRRALELFDSLKMTERTSDGHLRLVNFAKYHKDPTREEQERAEARARMARKRAAARASRDTEARGESEDAQASTDEVVPEKWAAALAALRGTGKFSGLSAEHLAIVDREIPAADLDLNYSEIVVEAEGVAGGISSALPWLRSAAKKLVARSGARVSPRKEDPPVSEPEFDGTLI